MQTSAPVTDLQSFTRQELALLDPISDAVTVRDLDNRIVFWNHAAEERYGWNRKEVLGKLSHDVLQTEFPIPFDEIRKELVRTGGWHGEVSHTGGQAQSSPLPRGGRSDRTTTTVQHTLLNSVST